MTQKYHRVESTLLKQSHQKLNNISFTSLVVRHVNNKGMCFLHCRMSTSLLLIQQIQCTCFTFSFYFVCSRQKWLQRWMFWISTLKQQCSEELKNLLTLILFCRYCVFKDLSASFLWKHSSFLGHMLLFVFWSIEFVHFEFIIISLVYGLIGMWLLLST